MSFGFVPFIGLGISVEDIYFGEEDKPEEAEKHIWVLFHLPFCRIGIII